MSVAARLGSAWLVGLALLIAASGDSSRLAPAATGAGQPVPASHEGHEAAALPASGGARLWLVQDSGPVAVANGHLIALDRLAVQVWVTPFPPGRAATIHYQLQRGGNPLDWANITLSYDHTVMEHGPLTASATPVGLGHYHAQLDFMMAGVFWIHTDIEIGDQHMSIQMLIEAHR